MKEVPILSKMLYKRVRSWTTPGNSDYLSLFSSHPLFMWLNWLWKASVINPFSIWSLFIIKMLVVSTVLDKISGKPRPPSPKSKMGKLCVLALHTTSSLIWGDLVCCFILFSARSDLGKNKCKSLDPWLPPNQGWENGVYLVVGGGGRRSFIRDGSSPKVVCSVISFHVGTRSQHCTCSHEKERQNSLD